MVNGHVECKKRVRESLTVQETDNFLSFCNVTSSKAQEISYNILKCISDWNLLAIHCSYSVTARDSNTVF